MESPSGILHTWRRLLLTASILYCQIQLSSDARAPVRIVPNPSYGTVGSNITLAIEGFSGNVFSYTWYRKSVEIRNQIGVLSVRSRKERPHIRERVLSDGSLLISNLTLSDIGDYIIQIVDSTTGVIETAQTHLSVYDVLSKPTIVSTNVAPVENMDTVSLTCQTLSQDVKFHWITPKDPPIGDRIKLSPDKRKLTIIKVSREDQGSYRCIIQNQVSEKVSEQFILTVTAAKSPEQSRGSSLFGRTSAVTVAGVLTGGTLIRCLI